jgi:hypothetical protein
MNLSLKRAATLPLANHPAISYMIRQGSKLFRRVFPTKVVEG